MSYSGPIATLLNEKKKIHNVSLFFAYLQSTVQFLKCKYIVNSI